MDILLISEDYIKSNSSLDDNTASKYVLAAILNAQNIELRSIIGKCLLEKLQQLINDDEIDEVENLHYKDLLDMEIQPFLLYQVLSDIIIPVSYKIGNMGVLNTEDEKAIVAANAQVNLVKDYYMMKADVFKKRLQEYLLRNKSAFPELNCCDINLESSNSSGIWLGGRRSKILPRRRCCRRD